MERRVHEAPSTRNLAWLGIDGQVRIYCVDPSVRDQITGALQAIAPSEIYNLSGQSSVGLSYSQPVDAFMSHAVGTLNILELLRSLALDAKLFNASSGEIFGNTDGDKRADESSPIDPCSPYGAAKASATLLVKSYRDVFGLFACSGLMFNHESPLRPQNFVAQRIVHGAIDIAHRGRERLTLGNLSIVRDWGWAPDFVGCMWAMLQQDKPRDFVVATGIGTSLEDFADHVFRRFKLNWKERVDIDNSLKRRRGQVRLQGLGSVVRRLHPVARPLQGGTHQLQDQRVVIDDQTRSPFPARAGTSRVGRARQPQRRLPVGTGAPRSPAPAPGPRGRRPGGRA